MKSHLRIPINKFYPVYDDGISEIWRVLAEEDGKMVGLRLPKHLNPYTHRYMKTPIIKSEAPPEIRDFSPFTDTLKLIRGENWDFIDGYKKYLSNKKVVLAGGCIRDLYLLSDPSKIKDIDAWILGCKDDNEAEHLSYALNEIQNRIGESSEFFSTHYLIEKLKNRKENIRTLSVTNMKIPSITDIPIQVMCSTANTVEELLESFDWGICQFAYDGKEFWFPGWKDFAAGYLSLNDCIPDPFYTLRRGILFSEKYKKKVRLRKTEALTLLSLMLMQHDGKDDFI